MINDARGGGDQLQMIFALQTLLDHVHVEKAEKAAAVAETQRDGSLRLKDESRVI